jgi:hypothetical protein
MNNSLSTSEDKILLFLSGSLLTTYFLDIFYRILIFIMIPRRGAIDFFLEPFPVSKKIPYIQIILIPLLAIFIFKQNKFIFSFIVSLISSFLYFYWVLETFWGRKTFYSFDLANETFNTYLMADSSVLEFVQFLLISIIFVAQTIFLSRFTIEKFQAKIFSR